MLKPLISLLKYLLIVFLLIFFYPCVIFGNQSQYIYDDVGRLNFVIDGSGNYLRYEYDPVGNLTVITPGIAAPSPPTLSSISPAMLFIGSGVAAAITGANLLTTKNVTSNPAMPIRVLNVSDTQIVIEITVPSNALPGTTVVFTVTTLYGSANISAALTSSILSFYPGQIAIAPGHTGSVTASISPPAGQNITITLTNSNPDIASVPAVVTIPSGGITTFNVTAVKDGVTTITSGGSGSTTVVFVEDPFTTLPGETVTNMAGPVSVYIDTPTTANTTTPALPVSVFVDIPTAVNTTTPALPVSVWPQQCSSNPVRMSGSNPVYYPTLQAAYDAANDGDTLQSKALELAGDLNVNAPKSVTLQGGYDCNYVTAEGMTLLNGVLTITDGTLIIENVILE